MADIIISGQGFYTISSLTQPGHEWLVDNVAYEAWQSSENGARGELSIVCDDTGMAEDIADGAHAAGLVVEVNGRRYIGNGRCQIGEAS